MTTETTNKIETTKNGYAKHARCGKNHSGNHGLFPDSRGQHWECQGCGTFYTAEQVASPQSGGEIGSMGVIPA